MKSKSVFLKVKDHSVSGEFFELVENSEFGFLETIPKPALNKLSEYYKSEDYISHTDAKRNSFEKAYHFIRTIALKNKLRLIDSFQFENKHILDIGCGTGEFLLKVKQNNWTVTGIEPNAQARAIANKKLNGLVYDIDVLDNFFPNSFDVITLWHVLEHLPDLENQINNIKKLLKPNGVLIIAVPNFKSFDAKYYKQFWAAYDVPRHLWHFDKISISKLFLKYNMKVNKTLPMWYDAFYVSLLSEKIKHGKIYFFSGIFVAMLSNIKSLLNKETSSVIYVIKNS